MSLRSIKKSLALPVVALCLMSLLPSRALAWGPNGHRIVALIAQAHLNPRARQNIRRILGNASLASVANFADVVLNRPRRPRTETRKMHFVNIPVTNPDSSYDASRDCKPSTQGDCAIAAIDRLTATLSNPQSRRAARAEALKFLVHFVGDLHQPLHSAERKNAAGRGDFGGGGVNVTGFGSADSLHKVWDSGIILRAMREPDRNTEAKYVRTLEQAISSGTISPSDAGTDVDWANEAHVLATANAYGKLPPTPDSSGTFALDEEYFAANKGVVDQQLARAGLRLAKVLNDLFDK